MTRRQFVGRCCTLCSALAAGGTAGALLAGCRDGSGTKATLRVGHLPAGCVQHLLLAMKRGRFKQEGLNVELTQFTGPSENIRAFVAGAHDVMHNPWTSTVDAYVGGRKNLRIIGGSGKGGIELVAREGSVRTVADLAKAADTGLRVGTVRRDTLELVTYAAMKRAGVGYSDYEMTFFGDMVEMGEALTNDQVDVCSLAQPYCSRVLATAGGTYLADSNDAWGPDAPDCVITVKAGFLERNAGALETYLGVLDQAARRRDADFETAVEELETQYGMGWTVLAAGLSRQVPQPVLDRAAVRHLHDGVSFLIELGYLTEDPIKELFDGSVQPRKA